MKFGHTFLLLTALSGVASAATIVQTQSFGFIPAGTAPLTYNKFNTALGTLTSITITTNVTKEGGSLFVDNESATPASGNISQSVTINLTSSSVTLTDTAFGPIGNGITATSTYAASVTGDNGDGGGVQADTPGNDYDGTVFGSTSVFQTKFVNTTPVIFNTYQGLGTYIINAGGVQGFDTSAIGGAAVAIDPARVLGNVVITYTYDAIPEPTAAVIGGLGLLTLLRRRRR